MSMYEQHQQQQQTNLPSKRLAEPSHHIDWLQLTYRSIHRHSGVFGISISSSCAWACVWVYVYNSASELYHGIFCLRTCISIYTYVFSFLSFSVSSLLFHFVHFAFFTSNEKQIRACCTQLYIIVVSTGALQA